MSRVSFPRLLMLALALAAAPGLRAVAQPADAEPPRFKRPVAQVAGARNFDPDQVGWPLASTTPGTATINYMQSLTAPTLFCVYRNPRDGETTRDVTLWRGSRPDLSRATPSDMDGMNGIKRTVTADIAVSACPPNWGAALNLVWGPGALDELRGQAQSRQKRDADREVAWQAQERQKALAGAQQWQTEAAAAPPTTAAQDLTLARRVVQDIETLEARIDSLDSRPFDTLLRGEVGDRIVRLSQIAYVKSRSLDAGRNRAAFDAWDNTLGGPALSAIVRLETIIYSRVNRRVRLAEISSPDAGQREMESWNLVDMSRFVPAKTTLLDIMTRQLAGRQLVDPGFLKQIAVELERKPPQGDPGRPYYRHVPAERQPAWMSSRDDDDDPGMAGRAVSGVIGAINGVGDMIRLIEKIDADARESREAFWRCYATRCKTAGPAFYAYSQALRSKDAWLIFRPVAFHPILTRGLLFLGSGNVDGGNIQGCQTELLAIDAALAPATQAGTSNPVQSATQVKAVMHGPTYAAWRNCRDRMEYILRPRFP